jgi:hypothetical protein
MSTIAIDINDAGIVLADESGVVADEPGYAFVEGQAILTGRDAYAKARLHPRQSNNRYWESLTLEPGSAGVDGVGSAAELAYAQLKALWENYGGNRDDALLLVPGYYGRDELGVLLGLAHECDIPVRSMLNSAAAAAAAPYPGRQLVHVDAGLHRVSATPLAQSEDVAADSQRSLANTGLASIFDLLAKRVAELFVLATRFDPFHSAASEQLVYDRLPAWLGELERHPDSVELKLPRNGDDLTIEVERVQLIGVMTGFYKAIVQLIAQCREPGAELVVLLSDRLARMPGMVGELERLDDALVVTLPAGQAALGAVNQAQALIGDSGNVRLLKRVPWREPPAEPAPARRTLEPDAPEPALSTADDPASHIVYRGIAYPIDSSGIVIGREPVPQRRTIVLDGGQGGVSRAHCELVRQNGELKLVDKSRFGTFVNEKRISGEIALQPADVIRIGSPGEQLQVIRMEAADGT